MQPRFSPDGRALAVGIRDVTLDIWILDLETGTRRRLTTDGNNQICVWSGDGERIFFSSDRVREVEQEHRADQVDRDPREDV